MPKKPVRQPKDHVEEAQLGASVEIEGGRLCWSCGGRGMVLSTFSKAWRVCGLCGATEPCEEVKKR